MLAAMGFGKKNTVEALLAEAAAGNIAKVLDILSSGISVNAKHSLTQRSALHEAAENGHCTMVQRLVERGATVDVVDNKGDTPYILAVYNLHADTIAFLKKKGADVEVLYRAVEEMHDAKIRLLLIWHDAKDDSSPHTPRFSERYPDSYPSLVEQARVKALTPAKKKYPYTPLYYAVIHGLTAVVARLIAAGADINAPIILEFSPPLYHAVGHDCLEVARLLLSSGATIKSEIMELAIERAVVSNNISMLSLLLESAPFKEMKVLSSESSILQHAIERATVYADGHPDEPIHGEVIKALVAAGADIRPGEVSQVHTEILDPRILPLVRGVLDASTLAYALNVPREAGQVAIVTPTTLPFFRDTVLPDAAWYARKAGLAAWVAAHPPRDTAAKPAM